MSDQKEKIKTPAPSVKEIEEKWRRYWTENNVYAYDPKVSRKNTYIVDTPPPTSSGSLHVGHIFSYTHTDITVRYQRMTGKNIFYPIGWDDNGLPTERRVQNYYGIKCNPALPYDPAFKAVHDPKKKDVEEVSRQNFIEACEVLIKEDEKAFANVFLKIGQSYDWNYQYATIDDHCRKIAQESFLDLVEKKLCYHADTPTVWDVTFQSAIAQAEIEDKEIDGTFHNIVFKIKETGDTFTIATTRPEYLAACIAVVAHPSDDRYKKFFGKTAVVPVFDIEVPFMPADHADIEKGTGCLMVCTFGDREDVDFWKKNKLPLKQIIGKDGRIMDIAYGESVYTSADPKKAKERFRQIVGQTIENARAKVVEFLTEENVLTGIEKIKHPVKFFEKGNKPLEYVPSRQWFINLLDHKKEFIDYGKKVKWHPQYMYKRYEYWVEGLNQDWCISRQRFFGVPVPVWYEIGTDGEIDYDKPIFPAKTDLPVDPMVQAPKGYKEDQRGKPSGFAGDKDIFDTWMTSSLTPKIAAISPDMLPADLRPNAHDIIRTWDFYTIVKSYFHEKDIPWKNAMISGFIMDPERKKMSKSKGNVITPEPLIDEHSADAVRYWAGKAKIGLDTAFDENLFKIGRKLMTKLTNVVRFVNMLLEPAGIKPKDLSVESIQNPLDLSYMAELAKVIDKADAALADYDYSVALQQAEDFFWNTCDNYIEIIKVRAYEQDRSALAGLTRAVSVFLRLFAPFLAYTTEDLWHQMYPNSLSVHKEKFPSSNELPREKGAGYAELSEIIAEIRTAKTKEGKNLRWPVDEISIKGAKADLETIKGVETDLLKVSNAKKAVYTEAKTERKYDVSVMLGKEEKK